jgi:hypothetical protein
MKMHESNDLFNDEFVGRKVARIEYVDDYDEGISIVFTDGSMLCISAYPDMTSKIQVCGSTRSREEA